ncbi:MAG: ATP-binding cassette domain-containing protein [Acidimicrobiia bacterium]|nr:ATP-binding cassette domain-containing protein [Acidimicrobiia bacterium]
MSDMVWILIPVVVVIAGLCLVDVARHDARHLPKWAWVLIILLVSFPLGAIAWFALGRVPRGEERKGEPPVGQAQGDVAAPVVRAAPTVPTNGTANGDLPLAVRTTGLSKIYGDTAALDDVDLCVPVGSTYGLIGPNGSGKTTMLSVLAGLRRPSAGEMELATTRQHMGLLVDTPLFEPWLTAREVVDLARHMTDPTAPRDRVEEVLVDVGLGDAIDRRCGGFSRGMLQRLGLAGCLVGDPEILVLDEPSSALDPAGRREVLDLVGRLAHTKTVLLSTHILSDVQQVCDTVGVIDRGRLLFQGPLAELLARTSTSYVLQVRPPADDLVQRLRAQDWTTEVTEYAPGRIRMVVADAVVAEREVPGLLAACGTPLVSFTPATDLESAFLELTA